MHMEDSADKFPLRQDTSYLMSLSRLISSSVQRVAWSICLIVLGPNVSLSLWYKKEKTKRSITVPAMMSYQDPPQRKLFYMGINLDKRIRKDHPLRKIRELIDFDFIYKEVEDKYG